MTKLLEEKIKEIKNKKRINKNLIPDILYIAENFISNFERTRYLKDDYIDTYVYCIRNDIKEIPKCNNPKCDKLVIKDPKKSKLQKYCSIDCKNEDCSRAIVERTMKKYGVRSTLELESVKIKARNTMMERYGVDNAMKSKEIMDRAKSTMIEKYGHDNGFYLKEYLKKNNVKCPLHIKENKEKLINTVKERYGVDNVMKSESIRNKMMKRTIDRIYHKIKENEYAFPLFDLEEFNGYFKPYTNIINRYLFKCKKCGNEFEDYMFAFNLKNDNASLHNFPRCYNCYPKSVSLMEQNLIDEVKKILGNNVKMENSCKIPNSRKEIDIFIPEKSIGIEMNGLFFHSERNGKDSTYHLDKTLKAKESGIRIIHIYSDEYANKKEIVISKLKHILGVNGNKKIYARKCKVEKIDELTARKFYDKNHIQGHSIGCVVHYGLYFESKLVSVMSFSKSRKSLGRKYHDGDYELIRFANDIDFIVIGSFGKLLKTFKREYKFKKIISYADIRWSSMDSNIYEKNGFVMKYLSKPSYYYIKHNGGDDTKRYNRFTFRKNVLKEKFPEIYNDNLSEKEIMEKAGFSRIWNCGNMVYELKN